MKYDFLVYSGAVANPNFFYYTGLNLTHAFLILEDLEGKGKTIITNALNRGFGRNFDGEFIVAEDIFDEVRKRVGQKIAIDSSMPFRVYKKICDGRDVIDAAELFYKKRMKKTSEEISKIKKAVSLSKGIIEKFGSCEGMNEEDVAKNLLTETYSEGLEPAFPPIVATGQNAATPHASYTKKIVRDFVLIDYGVKYKNYCGDITRCFFFNSKKASALKEKYEKLKELAYRLIDNGGGFKKSDELHNHYEDLNSKFGFPRPIHSIGHGIGLEVHEYPRFGKKYSDEIAFSTFTIEPGIYYDNYGLRYEETVYHNGKRIIVL